MTTWMLWLAGASTLLLFVYLVYALAARGGPGMNANNLFQTGLYIVVLIALAIPLGRYMTAVMDGSSVVVRRIGRPIETLLYKLAGVDPQAEMSWKHYALAVLAFNALGVLVRLRVAAPAAVAAGAIRRASAR